MKIKLPFFILTALSTLTFSVSAQTYTPLDITSGYTVDIVANGAGTAASSTTADADGVDYCFMSNDFDPTGSTNLTYALPLGGAFNSEANAAIGFQLADYSTNNSLQISTNGNSGTLMFSNSVEASMLYLVGTSGSGASIIDVLVTFTDATTETFTTQDLPDWFNSTVQPVALSGFGRVNMTTDAIENPSGNPRLYQIALDIALANEGKTIQSVQVTKASGTGIVNIMAITAELSPTCYPVTNLVASATGPDSGTVTWDASISNPANGYDYYLATNSTAPDAGTTPTGTIPVSDTSIDFTSLTTGSQYYFWIRSNCGGDLGSWEMTTFTPGQISVTYTAEDIQTLYALGTSINTSSTTPCPGILTITVPDGFQVNGVAVSYNMSTASNGWMSEQRSLLVCNTTSMTEVGITSGAGDSTGMYEYSRSGLDIANGATGDVEFELRAWRTYGSSDCNTDYNKVDNNSWTITITYESTLSIEDHNFENIALFPNPTQSNITVKAKESISKISIFNLLGQRVMTQIGDSTTIRINLEQLPAGNYFIKTITETGKVNSSKLIKQ